MSIQFDERPEGEEFVVLTDEDIERLLDEYAEDEGEPEDLPAP